MMPERADHTEKDKKIIQLIEINEKNRTNCESAARVPEKARKDGAGTSFDRDAGMKPCPIGADSSCCRHCAMGPCRLNANDP